MQRAPLLVHQEEAFYLAKAAKKFQPEVGEAIGKAACFQGEPARRVAGG
jgi:hypothetical protein